MILFDFRFYSIFRFHHIIFTLVFISYSQPYFPKITHHDTNICFSAWVGRFFHFLREEKNFHWKISFLPRIHRKTEETKILNNWERNRNNIKVLRVTCRKDIICFESLLKLGGFCHLFFFSFVSKQLVFCKNSNFQIFHFTSLCIRKEGTQIHLFSLQNVTTNFKSREKAAHMFGERHKKRLGVKKTWNNFLKHN